MSNIRADYVGPSAGGTLRSLARGVVASWTNFNGIGTAAIRSSLNTASLVDGGTGTYTINLTSAFSTVDYQAGSSCYNAQYFITSLSTGSFSLLTRDGAGTVLDTAIGMPDAKGDLA